MTIKGTVVRASHVKPLVTDLDFTCGKCGESTSVKLIDGVYKPPTSCSGDGCRGKTFVAERATARSIDWQKLRIQARHLHLHNLADGSTLRDHHKRGSWSGHKQDISKFSASLLNHVCACHAVPSDPRLLLAIEPHLYSMMSCSRSGERPFVWLSAHVFPRLQELNNADSDDSGRIPRTIDVELLEDLVDCCSPGDVVTVLGLVKVISTDLRQSGEASLFRVLAPLQKPREQGNFVSLFLWRLG